MELYELFIVFISNSSKLVSWIVALKLSYYGLGK